MDRSRAYWRSLLKRILFGERDDVARRWSKRERAIYAVFGLTSLAYTIVLRAVIVFYVGAYLAEEFNVAGFAFAAGLGAFYIRRPLGEMSSAIRNAAGRIYETRLKAMREGVMRTGDEKNVDQTRSEDEGAKTKTWRRRIVWLASALVVAGVLCTPWNASVGGYGALVATPDHEVVVRAPEDSTLIELRAQPGDFISGGSLIGRMIIVGNTPAVPSSCSRRARTFAANICRPNCSTASRARRVS